MGRILLLTVASLSVSTALSAQTPMLTLEEAVARTLARNPAVRSSVAGEDEARARAREVRGEYLPRVEALEGWQRGDHPVFVFSSSLAQRRFTAEQFAIDLLNNPTAMSNHRAALVLQQTIFDRGLTARNRAANAGVEIATLGATRVKADLRLAAISAYAGLAAASARHGSARATMEAATEDVRRTEARRDAGLETEANVLALRVHASEADARRIRTAADEAVALAELNALMDEPLDAVFQLAALDLTHITAVELRAMEASALANRPELHEAAVRRTQAAAERQTAAGALWPRFVAQAAVEANGPSFGSRASAWAAGVELRWTLFNGGANLARMQAAAAAQTRADAEAAAATTRVLLEVRRAYAMQRAALARELTGRHRVEQARESQRMIRDRYDAGLASATELLRTAQAVAEAEAERSAALADVYVAAASLARATGASELNP